MGRHHGGVRFHFAMISAGDEECGAHSPIQAKHKQKKLRVSALMTAVDITHQAGKMPLSNLLGQPKMPLAPERSS